jgi:hypothetical protein
VKTYEWFKIKDGNSLNELSEKVDDWNDIVLNFPSNEATSNPNSPEAKLEKEISNSETHRQLPVGLFYKEKKDKNHITPGGSSAIDMWSIAKEKATMTIYELKCPGNNSVGIVSELFFYANVIKDLMIDKKIKYKGTEAAKCDFRSFKTVYNAANEGCIRKIDAVFFVSTSHPLLNDDTCKVLNNESISFRIKDSKQLGKTFKEIEQNHQAEWIHSAGYECGGIFRKLERNYCLKNQDENIFDCSGSGIEDVKSYFMNEEIKFWGSDEYTVPNNTLSSQVACLNFLFAVRNSPEIVLGIAKKVTGYDDFAAVEKVNCDRENKGYVAFEVVSKSDHLNEKCSTRGEYCTSIDAVIVAKKNDGKKVLILIEWKYTETYTDEDKSIEDDQNKPYIPHKKGEERLERYSNLIVNSSYLSDNVLCNGKNEKERCRSTLFFVEPFYQLMRQTLWAEEMIRNKGTEWVSADDYYHIHVVPKQNWELLFKKYSECKSDTESKDSSESNMERVWKSCLSPKGKERYKCVSPKVILNAIEESNLNPDLVEYLKERYKFLEKE